MKILQVMAGGQHGGAETAFVDICIGMHKAGQDIEVVTRKNAVRVPRLIAAGIKVHTLPFSGALDFYTKWAIKKIIQRFQPDIVQTWMSRATQKTPKWKTGQAGKRYLTVARLGGYYKISKYKGVDYFVANTPDLKRHIEAGGIAPSHVHHLNNFAEVEVNVTPVSRQDLETPEDATVLVALARLHVNKALDIAVEALADLPNAYLWLAGEGELRDELTAQAKRLGVFDRVRFLGWRTDRDALLQAADICLVISRIEPFGNVFIQSWANKTPVIVSDSEGPSQFCKDGEDSLMIPKNDSGALVAAVQKLGGDKALASNLVKVAYGRFENEFTKERCVQAYVDFYQETLRQESLL